MDRKKKIGGLKEPMTKAEKKKKKSIAKLTSKMCELDPINDFINNNLEAVDSKKVSEPKPEDKGSSSSDNDSAGAESEC
jgi:hypothetical protein